MKAMCLFSGGMDSTVMLYQLLDMGYEVEALSFDYGQKHLIELDCARKISSRLNIPHNILRIDLGLFGRSSLIESDIVIPDQEENRQIDTVVPFRNTFFIIYAAAYALSKGINELFISPVLEDYETFRDCRRDFFDSLEKTLQLGAKEDTLIKIQTPFIDKRKTEILIEGISLGVPFELTHTCYRGVRPACGKCDSCGERIAAFKEIHIIDPLKYQIEINWRGCESYIKKSEVKT
ncbi:MAG: 7-cyano-7-deazaguanine synthase QueC [Candidatus Hydrothermarchaeales archaeon]